MRITEHLGTAFDALRSNRLRAGLTTLGVIIGVVAVIVLVSVGTGFRQYLGSTFASMGTNLLRVTPGKRETRGGFDPPLPSQRKLTIEDARALDRRATALDGVCPNVVGAGAVRYAGRQRDTWIIGTCDRFPDIRNLRLEVGRFLSPEDVDARRRVVVVGRTVLKELFGEENPLGKAIKVAEAQYRVIGIMERKGTSLGFDLDDMVLVPVTGALDLFGLEGITEMLVRARSKSQVELAQEEIRSILRRRHNDNEDFTIATQDDLLSSVNKITTTMTMVLLAIASISLLVGGIGIANIMLVSVKERTREIGVRRAVGATRSDILWQFLVEAVVVSLLGGLVGLALGQGIVYVTHLAIPEISARLESWVVAIALAFSALVGVAAGVAPARRAASLNPVDALRYE